MQKGSKGMSNEFTHVETKISAYSLKGKFPVQIGQKVFPLILK